SGPGETESRGEMAPRDRRVQPACAHQWQQQRGLCEVVIEAVWLIGPGQAPVEREARVEVPRIGRVEAVEIGEAVLLEAWAWYGGWTNAGLEAHQRQAQDVI